MMPIFPRPMKFPAFALIAVALAVFAEPALAETTASFYLGSSHTGNSDVRISQPSTNSDATFHDVSWNSESFTNPVYYGIRVSHFFEEHPDWGIGFDYTHDKVYANTNQAVRVNGTWNGAQVNESAPMNQRVQSFSISHGVNIVALNAYRRWTRQTADSLLCVRCQPYVGAGLTYYVLHPENTVNGRANDQGFEGAGFGYQLLAGLHYGVTRTVGVFIETKYNSGKVEVKTAGGGRGETTLNSTQLLAGMSVAF